MFTITNFPRLAAVWLVAWIAWVGACSAADDQILLGVAQGAGAGGAPVWQWDFAATNALPGDGSVVVNSPSLGGLVTDSTGVLTFAGNNLVRSGASMSTQTTDVSLGTQNNYLLCFTGAGTVTLSGAKVGGPYSAGATKFTPTSAAALTMTVSGSVTNASLSAVTYETQCRAQDAVYNASDYFGPKFDYNAGLRRWGAQTNLNYPSSPATIWALSSATISGSVTGPDGVAGSATTIREDATIAQHFIYRSASTTAGLNYTATIFASQGVGRYLTLSQAAGSGGIGATVDLSNGAITQSGACGTGATFVSASAVLVNGFWRISVVGSSPNTTTYIEASATDTGTFSPTIGCNKAYLGTTTLTYNIFGGQFEQASFPSPYVPTGSAAVVASAESATPNPPLSTYLAAGPWAYSWTDGQTGSTACTTGAAGGFVWPLNGSMKALKVWPAGTPGGKVVC